MKDQTETPIPHEDPSPAPESVPPIQQPEPAPHTEPTFPTEPPHSPGSPIEPHPIDPSLAKPGPMRRRYHAVPAAVYIARRAACAKPWRRAS